MTLEQLQANRNSLISQMVSRSRTAIDNPTDQPAQLLAAAATTNLMLAELLVMLKEHHDKAEKMHRDLEDLANLFGQAMPDEAAKARELKQNGTV